MRVDLTDDRVMASEMDDLIDAYVAEALEATGTARGTRGSPRAPTPAPVRAPALELPVVPVEDSASLMAAFEPDPTAQEIDPDLVAEVNHQLAASDSLVPGPRTRLARGSQLAFPALDPDEEITNVVERPSS
jgi:hypothetical protein